MTDGGSCVTSERSSYLFMCVWIPDQSPLWALVSGLPLTTVGIGKWLTPLNFSHTFVCLWEIVRIDSVCLGKVILALHRAGDT